jgi:Protein of unknown function (DUF1570)
LEIHQRLRGPRIAIRGLLLVLLLSASAWAQDLRVFETAHYRIHTDLDDDFAGDLGHRMDVMYDEYARRLAGFNRPSDSTPLEVYLVHSQRKYLGLAGYALSGTGGSFNSARHLVAAFLDGQGRDALRRTLQHEAFHQFAAEAIGKNLPIWLNEGLAQVFEEGIWTGDGFMLGQVPPRRLRQLHHDIDAGAMIDFSQILRMSPALWAANWRDPSASATEYNQAWAMAHFLVYAADESGTPRFRARLIEMLKMLRDGAGADKAFRTAFSDNIEGFHDRFLEYTQALQPTPLATLIEDQGVLADMLAQAKQRGTTFDSFADFRELCCDRDWRIHYRRGTLEWESAADPAVYFSSPTGYVFEGDDQHFETAMDRPLPDLVCHCDGMPTLRTRFSENNGKIEHETVVDWQQ